MRWHALARAGGQGHVASSKFRIESRSPRRAWTTPNRDSRTYRDGLRYRTYDTCVALDTRFISTYPLVKFPVEMSSKFP